MKQEDPEDTRQTCQGPEGTTSPACPCPAWTWAPPRLAWLMSQPGLGPSLSPWRCLMPGLGLGLPRCPPAALLLAGAVGLGRLPGPPGRAGSPSCTPSIAMQIKQALLKILSSQARNSSTKTPSICTSTGRVWMLTRIPHVQVKVALPHRLSVMVSMGICWHAHGARQAVLVSNSLEIAEHAQTYEIVHV